MQLFTWKFKLSLSKFLQLKINCLLFRFLPFSISRWYIAILGKLYYFLNRKEKILIRNTIKFIYKRKMDSEKVKVKIKEAFKGIFDHYHEKLFVAYSHFQNLLRFLDRQIRLEGEDALRTALESGKGVILVTGHFGAVEFLPGCLAVKGFPASMICRFQTNRLRQSLQERSDWVGLNLIDADEGSIFRAAMDALKQGRILITECDEFDEWRADERRDTYFLNQKLPYDRTLDLLRKRSGAPVVTAFMRREGRQQYAMDLTLIANGAASGVQAVNEQCLATLEAAIDAAPEQWYQWKKLGKIINSRLEVEHDRQESGYLAPEVGISFADQA